MLKLIVDRKIFTRLHLNVLFIRNDNGTESNLQEVRFLAVAMTCQTLEEKVFIISVYVHICVNLIRNAYSTESYLQEVRYLAIAMACQTPEEKVFIISVYVHICVNLILRDVRFLVHIHLFCILKYIKFKYFFACLVWFFTSQSTAMVMLGQSVHLTTHFSWASLTKKLTSTLC